MIKLTEEERQQLLTSYVNGLGIERRHLSKEETEQEIVKFLSLNNVCVLATVGSDGKPRSTVVDYEHDGMTIYIMTEGGVKVDNILVNPNVSLGIYAPHKTMRGVMGLNYQGTAEVFTFQEHKDVFMKVLPLFSHVIENFKKEVKGVTPRPDVMKAIKISPVNVNFICYARGLPEAVWKK